MPSAVYRSSVCFNPRTHMGCDGCWLIIAFCGHRRFNPRTHMGCDFRLCSRYTVLRLFQSTHPHGVRQLRRFTTFIMALFQSTHPHGVRLIPSPLTATYFLVSIHAPTWGATYRTSVEIVFALMFQSTHPHGVRRRSDQRFRRRLSGFNPRTHMGCDFIRTFHRRMR